MGIVEVRGFGRDLWHRVEGTPKIGRGAVSPCRRNLLVKKSHAMFYLDVSAQNDTMPCHSPNVFGA